MITTATERRFARELLIASAAIALFGGCRLIIDADDYTGVGQADGDGGSDVDAGDGDGIDAGGVDAMTPPVSECVNRLPGFAPPAWLLQDGMSNGDVVLSESGTWTLDTVSGDLMAPNGSVHLTNALQQNAQSDGTFIAGLVVDDLFMPAATDGPTELRIQGERPLVIVSRGTLLLQRIDISGRADLPAPAGANRSMSCQNGGTGRSGDLAGRGGGGGAFAGFGGFGGIGSFPGDGPAGGMPDDPVNPDILRGGCSGGAGGDPGIFGGSRAAGGMGGGALYLFACGEMSLSDEIDASGQGGAGSGPNNGGGGGGGGSGGFVGLNGNPLYNTSMKPFDELINVGGGGGGAGGSTTSTQTDGAQGSPTMNAQGGNAPDGGVGGNGGAIAVGTNVDGSPGMDDNDGGGGGGGSAGRLVDDSNG